MKLIIEWRIVGSWAEGTIIHQHESLTNKIEGSGKGIKFMASNGNRICSVGEPYYYHDANTLYIRGWYKKEDNKKILVPKECLIGVKQAIK